MNDNRILKQFYAMFGTFMVIFYLGMGIFFLFFASRMFNMNSAFSGLMGGTFLIYGLYRTYVTYKQIVQAFFRKDQENEE
ncbi:MAG: hypothetical protein JXN62_10635 [Bacteroidales bacterium]|nr:hypothetical protein [Bacteroidales bacterium]